MVLFNIREKHNGNSLIANSCKCSANEKKNTSEKGIRQNINIKIY